MLNSLASVALELTSLPRFVDSHTFASTSLDIPVCRGQLGQWYCARHQDQVPPIDLRSPNGSRASGSLPDDELLRRIRDGDTNLTNDELNSFRNMQQRFDRRLWAGVHKPPNASGSTGNLRPPIPLDVWYDPGRKASSPCVRSNVAGMPHGRTGT